LRESEELLKEKYPHYLKNKVEDRLLHRGRLTKYKLEEKKEIQNKNINKRGMSNEKIRSKSKEKYINQDITNEHNVTDLIDISSPLFKRKNCKQTTIDTNNYDNDNKIHRTNLSPKDSKDSKDLKELKQNISIYKSYCNLQNFSKDSEIIPVSKKMITSNNLGTKNFSNLTSNILPTSPSADNKNDIIINSKNLSDTKISPYTNRNLNEYINLGGEAKYASIHNSHVLKKSLNTPMNTIPNDKKTISSVSSSINCQISKDKNYEKNLTAANVNTKVSINTSYTSNQASSTDPQGFNKTNNTNNRINTNNTNKTPEMEKIRDIRQHLSSYYESKKKKDTEDKDREDLKSYMTSHDNLSNNQDENLMFKGKNKITSISISREPMNYNTKIEDLKSANKKRLQDLNIVSNYLTSLLDDEKDGEKKSTQVAYQEPDKFINYDDFESKQMEESQAEQELMRRAVNQKLKNQVYENEYQRMNNDIDYVNERLKLNRISKSYLMNKINEFTTVKNFEDREVENQLDNKKMQIGI
jgi:hypothetical protein